MTLLDKERAFSHFSSLNKHLLVSLTALKMMCPLIKLLNPYTFSFCLFKVDPMIIMTIMIKFSKTILFLV